MWPPNLGNWTKIDLPCCPCIRNTKMKHILQAIVMRIVEAMFTEECYKMPNYTIYSCPNYGRYTGKIDVVVVGKDPYEKYTAPLCQPPPTSS